MKKVVHKSLLSHQELERRRLKAVKFFKQGKSNTEISRILSVSYEAVRLWKHSWKKKGIKGLKSKGKPGPKPQLTEEKKEKVKQVLLKGPQAFGYSTNIWTLKRITEVIKKVVKVKHHPGYVWYILQSMGWSCQRPRVQSKYRDERIIAKWKRVVWPAIKKRGSN